MKCISAFKPIVKQADLREYFRTAPYIKRADQVWLKELIHAALTNSAEIRTLASGGAAGAVDAIDYRVPGADIRAYFTSNTQIPTGQHSVSTIEEYDTLEPTVFKFEHLAKRGTRVITVNVRCAGRRLGNEFPLAILTFENEKGTWSKSLLLWNPEQDSLRYEVFTFMGRDCYAPPRSRHAA